VLSPCGLDLRFALLIAILITTCLDISAPFLVVRRGGSKIGDGVVVDGGTFSRSFDSWAKLRMELLRANVLSPAYLTHAEDNFYRGESWQSPDTVSMTDGQMKELQLKRQ
jgi:hypothetical protein